MKIQTLEHAEASSGMRALVRNRTYHEAQKTSMLEDLDLVCFLQHVRYNLVAQLS